MPKVSRVGKLRQTAEADRRNRTAGASSKTAPAAGATDGVSVAAAAAVEGQQQQHHHLSRGQRKRQAKRDKYLKNQRLVLSALRLKEEESQKKRIDGLDALKRALSEVANAATAESSSQNNQGGTKTGNKKSAAASVSLSGTKLNLSKTRSQKSLSLKELPHFDLVLQHPSFQQNPFETMQLHLRNTLKQDAADLQETTTMRNADPTSATPEKTKRKKHKGRSKSKYKVKTRGSR